MPRNHQIPSRCTLAVLPTVLLVLACTSQAGAAEPGPRLEETPGNLAAALKCSPNVSHPAKTPVLLVHGTGATWQEDFGWNFAKILPQAGYPVCTVQIPSRAMGDLQRNVEYVVYAIRTIAERGGQKVAVIGHSQGAFLPSYALRFWPDLAKKVADVIGFAGTYTYGSDQAKLICTTPCTAAFRQFTPGSKFLTALGKHPLPAGPSYTGFSTRYDEVVVPQPMASTIVAPGARNYVLQDLCPVDTAEHLLIIGEKPFVQLTLDALANAGPASLDRIGKVTCGMIPSTVGATPGVVTFDVGAVTTAIAEPADAEPPLRAYMN